MRLEGTLLAVLYGLAVLGCDGSTRRGGAGTQNGTGNGGGQGMSKIDAGVTNRDGGFSVTTGRLTLTVNSAREESTLASRPTTMGMYVVVDLAIANGLDTAIDISPPNFRLKTEGGLEVLAASVSSDIAGACPDNALLSAGQVVVCNVAFETDPASVPTGLVYASSPTGGEPIQVEASIGAFRRCDRCASECTDLASDPMNCGRCFNEIPFGGTCAQGEAKCPDGRTNCGGRCVDTRSDRDHCGSCNVRVGEGMCASGVPWCSGGLTFDRGRCLDLNGDRDHCGAVGQRCESGFTCEDGQCVDFVNSGERRPCTEVCAAEGLVCIGVGDLPRFEYECPDEVGVAFVQTPCAQEPPAMARNPQSGLTCTYEQVACFCQ